MPLQATSGAASYDAFGGGVPVPPPNYIEDVFSTWLYTGVGGTQTITNGIDLSTKGGLVWIKDRTSGVTNHTLVDTVRGANQRIFTNLANAQSSGAGGAASFLSNGFTSTDSASGNAFVSWTMREQAKFFDVVTFTATAGATNQRVSHNLGSVPGFIMVKSTSATSNWFCYHRSLGRSQVIFTDLTNVPSAVTDVWGTSDPTSTDFGIAPASLGNGGHTCVAYVFAHDAGGFGLTGTDNVISCGSFSTDASGNATISLGYEPQWVLFKRTNAGSNWSIYDTTRGWDLNSDQLLSANLTSAESNLAVTNRSPTATGFQFQPTGQLNVSSTFIYIAIRRGPMKVPTSGTSVFTPTYGTASGYNAPQTTGFPVDMQIYRFIGEPDDNYNVDRLRGVNTTATNNSTPFMQTNRIQAESSSTGVSRQWTNTTFGSLDTNLRVYYSFGRAPSFFDEVCYTGTGVARTVTHNLGVAPELMIVKKRSATDDWAVYYGSNTNFLLLNTNASTSFDTNYWNGTFPTSTVFSVGTDADVNTSAATYVAYLFATCTGVSKVGTYTGTGTTKQIDCGFTSGARFVLIKSIGAEGDWYVWDSARGIVAGNDPYLLLNTRDNQVTNTDYVDTYSAGFEISSTAPAAINANGGTFIFLAIA